MITGKIIWVPYPYKAGICVTDDTDAATLAQTKTVYDFLLGKNFLTTKTVWALKPNEKCGIPPTPDSTLRGITLQDEQYLNYCKLLKHNGYEISLHGASAGNNGRGSTKNAFELLENKIGMSDTFICHSKNADNIYWNDKITSIFPFNFFLKIINKFECSGELESSPYFWGDICYKKINQIRLYRTRCINTLKKNPSMPYYKPNQKYVNGWFAATKRSISDCAKKENLDKLISENGLTVLYQYMHRYANEDGVLNQNFVTAINSITANPNIKVDTVSNTMKRLRIIQGIYIFYSKRNIWLINTNNTIVKSLQIQTGTSCTLTSNDCDINQIKEISNIQNIPANSIVVIKSRNRIKLRGRNCFSTYGKRQIYKKIGDASLYLNLTKTPWNTKAISIAPHSFLYTTAKSGTGLSQHSTLPVLEEISLILGQLWIIIREILFKGRSLNSNKFLDDSKEIKLENHDNW